MDTAAVGAPISAPLARFPLTDFPISLPGFPFTVPRQPDFPITSTLPDCPIEQGFRVKSSGFQPASRYQVACRSGEKRSFAGLFTAPRPPGTLFSMCGSALAGCRGDTPRLGNSGEPGQGRLGQRPGVQLEPGPAGRTSPSAACRRERGRREATSDSDSEPTPEARPATGTGPGAAGTLRGLFSAGWIVKADFRASRAIPSESCHPLRGPGTPAWARRRPARAWT